MFEIIYEDDFLLIINKASGVVVNRAQTSKEVTLQDQISDYFKLGGKLGLGDRAGIVHRLDRETSGLLVVAKTQKAFDDLQMQFRQRIVKKKYIALVHGFVKGHQGSIVAEIGRVGKFGKFGIVKGARESVSDYIVETQYIMPDDHFNQLLHRYKLTKVRINYLRNHAKEYALLSIFPKTGRTHQVRVHLKSINHPVVSDLIYTPNKLLTFDLTWCPRLYLHAAQIEFTHPQSKKAVKYTSQLPKDLDFALGKLILLRLSKRGFSGQAIDN
ncbi:hypothetical protein A3F02_00415 [Candidatus Curtissbacteria bacterium RIFCSPHIGHO2_12_FULL_38_9b]|uniref:Pseudouridine synthase RsuA/RluA-like domain-containing protein n=2 Tax=Candidatus Curtissiibacteriota TaxID=1752717 RepID=A0A1F5GYW9_9BACT|nr:MAG: hypothetical protein A3A48_02355 [Candidatus Curtissbacteria bacterium RIFCSPLOWO2_01_FULL_37_9]OGD97086.1 MAG: hypothetical protein A3F02_00415 [Candidatus Curtissbacteria bacterium RIFCSPHIGHO2_12_FULL_38_9b]